MLSNSTQIGATTQGTTFADIIINNVNGVADGMIQGFAQFVHDPKSLKETVSIFSKAAAPRKFADAVVLRRIETQKLDDIWNFPLNLSCPTTCPLPWTIVEATVKSQTGNLAWEFNLMRTVDFIGRNYIRFVLPSIDTSQVADSSIDTTSDLLADPDHIYLGAWHRDLIPRLIQSVSFYPRSNCHKLFEYTGYDIFVHNILFGNAHKEMNDLMSGEDKFELCYDPYRVDGSAMGLASFKGIDAYSDYEITDAEGNVSRSYETAYATAKDACVSGPLTFATKTTNEDAGDSIIDYFQLDTTMDNAEFRNVYRRNVWYEAPVAKNYHARHSIHSRRMFHQAKDIVIPLDILPFGYSVASSLPTAALSGECGFIKIQLFEDWLDRAFYLTKVSDIPSLHPIVNHVHYAAGDYTPDGQVVAEDDPFCGWVNERSLGRFGDPAFTATRSSVDGTSADMAKDGFESVYKYTTDGAVLGTPVGFNNRDNIVPTKITFENPTSNRDMDVNESGVYRNSSAARPPIAHKGHSNLQARGNFRNMYRTSTSMQLTAAARQERLSSDKNGNMFLYKMSDIDSSYYNQIKETIGVKLLQVGYQTLPCIREFLAKLPNIYITTEWDDKDRSISDTTFDINNDLYIQGIILWFIPTDNNNLESMRVYPCHMIDHELPLIAGLKLINEQSQGTTIYDWSILNVLTPAQMNLNPLIENMGLISFSPSLTSNTLPLAYYDSNISGYLKCELKSGENGTNFGQPVNLKQGIIKVISIGVNGVASVNLNLFRLVF